MEQLHSLLKRQLRKYFGGQDQYPAELKPFIQAINDAYIGSDSDLHMLEHSLELSSDELLQANSELRAIFQAFPDLLFHLDKDGKIIDCKGNGASDASFLLTTHLGKYIHEIPFKDIADKLNAIFLKVKQTKTADTLEFPLHIKDSERIYEARFLPLPEGHTIIVVRNITERKRIETALRESERRLADIINFLPDATFAIDSTGAIIAWNHAMEEMTGYSADDMLGKRDHSYAEPFYGQKKPMLVDLVLRSDANIEKTYSECNKESNIVIGETFIPRKTSGGSYYWIKASPLYDSDGSIVGAIETIRDISERKRNEEALRDSGERLKKQQATLINLARNKSILRNGLSLAVREITEATAHTLDVERASIWLFNDSHTELICQDLYENSLHTHSSGRIIRVTDRPNYFKALESERTIAAREISKDPRTKEIADSYISENGVTSLLDVPILLGGRIVGVVCHRHIGPVREWTADEQSFSGSIADLVSLGIEVAERRKAETHLRIRTSAMNAATDQIVITNVQGKIEFVNPSFERETGYLLSEIEGQLPDFFTSEMHGSEFYSSLWNTINRGLTWHGEITLKRKDGNPVVEDVTITPIKNELGIAERFIAIKRNVTDKKIYEQQLDHLAHHDNLTGLPNRLLFSDKLTQCMVRAAYNNGIVAVLFLDLDQFKLINDTLGHSTGDLLLKAVSERLQKSIREADMIARMGGDEFTVILSDLSSEKDVEVITRRVVEALSEPFTLAGKELFVTVSIGIGLYPANGSDVETLVKNADSAMYRAKEQGRNNYQFYTQALNAAAVERMQLESSLRKAVERREFMLHYQPRVDVRTGQILGAEALIRWYHPELGIIPPSNFIPLAEETGLIIPISEWVIQTACAQNVDWQNKGLEPINIAVNISARHFRQDELVATVQNALTTTGLAPEYLELELTESVLMHSIDMAVDILGRLKSMGLGISIDDFGTGYSSLTYLKRFPIDTVKIDQSFIRDLTTNPDDAAIARAVIAMAQSLKLKVIAEGVETIEQLQFLRSLDCDEIQGYFVSRPVPAESFETIIREYSHLAYGDYTSQAA